MKNPPNLKSVQWHARQDRLGFIRRGLVKSMGYTDYDLGCPIIAVVNTWSELNPGHYHFRQLAEAVKRGIWQAGGFPLEFNTISLCEVFFNVSTLIYRNLLAMDTEEMVRAQPFDGAVFLSSCDKNVPAQLMACASVDIPSIFVLGGPMLPGKFKGEDIVCCTDGTRYWNEYYAGNVSLEEMAELEDCAYPGIGACGMMGTANTKEIAKIVNRRNCKLKVAATFMCAVI